MIALVLVLTRDPALAFILGLAADLLAVAAWWAMR